MGRATIVSGGADGRYTISLDWGTDVKAAVLSALSTLEARIIVNLAQAQSALAEADAREAAQQARYTAAVEAFAAAHNVWQPGAPKPDDSAILFELRALRLLQVQHYPLQVRVDAIKFELAQTRKRIAYWNDFSASETRQVWCTDFTEDGAPTASVATIDVPGESALLLLAPGCRAPVAADGQLRAREMMSPEQVFFNAAILPGWQVDKPTYRRGTIVALNIAANTATVDLDAATSSAQRLNINRATRLDDVPVEYMTCDCNAFEVGDRCIVQFVGQSWDSPKVIGFVDTPRPCNWSAVGMSPFDRPLFRSRIPALLASLISSGSVTMKVRWDRGAWVTMTQNAESNGTTLRSWGHTYTDLGVPSDIYCRLSTGDNVPSNVEYSYGIPCFQAAATPPQPSSTSQTIYRIYEYAAYLDGELVLNVAATDPGWTGSPNDSRVYVKTPGGITNEVGFELFALAGYTLLIEE